MYYKFSDPIVNGRREVVCNCKDIKKYITLSKKYRNIELIMPFRATIDPATMGQYYSKQSFTLESDKGKLTFFNIDTYHNLYQIFAAKEVLVYIRSRGSEERNHIIGYINSQGEEVLFW